MDLYYPQKKTIHQILNTTPICNAHIPSKSKKLLIKGDNLPVIQKLREDYSKKVDLIYIDPPFSTGTKFTIGKNRVSTISTSLDDDLAYDDNLKGYEFVEFIRERLIIARELLSDIGSIYVHIDYKIGHYVKIIMDEIFGINNFRNDITRIKCNPKNFQRTAFGNIKDMILFIQKVKISSGMKFMSHTIKMIKINSLRKSTKTVWLTPRYPCMLRVKRKMVRPQGYLKD